MYRLIAIAVGILIILRSFRNYRDKTISLQLFLVVAVGWSSVMALGIWPELSARLATLFGMGRGADFLTFVGMLFLLQLSLSLYIRIKTNQRDITRIVRELALADLRNRQVTAQGDRLVPSPPTTSPVRDRQGDAGRESSFCQNASP
jgi:hypothetical protein